MPEPRIDCMECGNWLPETSARARRSRADRLYCSDACRKRAYRREHGPKPPEKVCTLCGATFRPLRGKQAYCDYEDQADGSCAQLQNELRQRARELENERFDKLCDHCGEFTGWDGVGRPRRFCSARCKTAFYRAAKKVS
jgi:endogenous inhibitor of DNA gyrase (YacG/DUF329 family)